MSFRQVAAYFLATTLAVYAGISLSSSSISRGGGVECAQPQQFYESPLSTIEAPLNLTFSQLSDFLLDNYDVDGEDNTTSWDERIYDAFLAMELAETDGNPVPIHHHPYLFVGSAGAYGILHTIYTIVPTLFHRNFFSTMRTITIMKVQRSTAKFCTNTESRISSGFLSQ
jgi:hypothetical protein